MTDSALISCIGYSGLAYGEQAVLKSFSLSQIERSHALRDWCSPTQSLISLEEIYLLPLLGNSSHLALCRDIERTHSHSHSSHATGSITDGGGVHCAVRVPCCSASPPQAAAGDDEAVPQSLPALADWSRTSGTGAAAVVWWQ